MDLTHQLYHDKKMPLQQILQRQIQSIYKKHERNNHRINKHAIDPIQTSIFINIFPQLPPLSKKHIKSCQKERPNKTQSKKVSRFYTIHKHDSEIFKSQRKVNQSQTKQLKKEQKYKQKRQFVQIDILTLKTMYAKNNEKIIGQPLMKGEQTVKQLVKIPTQAFIADFIKGYKPLNENVSMDRLVKSQYFSVIYKQNQSLYFGEIRFGQPDGQGILITLSLIFQGFWRASQKIEGVERTLKGYFKGRFHGNQRSKVGEFFWNNGQYYSGQWLKNKKHGNGVWKSTNGDIYMGTWVNGAVQGFGIHLNKYGQKYEGCFHNFLKHGRGTQIFPNGDSFEGQFKQGKPSGFGVYKWKNGFIYKGQFKDGYRTGKGMISKVNMIYEGTFLKEKAHGNGRIEMNDGETFVGKFQEGKKSGKGIYKERRRVWIGNWHGDKFMQKSNTTDDQQK